MSIRKNITDRNRWRLPLWLCVLLPMCGTGHVQAMPVGALVADTMAVVQLDTTSVAAPQPEASDSASLYGFSTERLTFDPLKARLQKRYVEKGDTFKTRPFYERFFIGGHIGWQQMVQKGDKKLSAGVPLTLFAGYQFTRLHTLRLSASYVDYEVEGYSMNNKQASLSANYLFNLTSYLYGYRRKRLFSLSGMLGGSLIYSHFRAIRHWALQGEAGAHLALRMGRNAELFAEPFVALATDQIDHSAASNPSIYDVIYGVRAGVSLNFDRTPGYYVGQNYNGNLFFDFSQGGTMQYVRGGMPLLQTLGTNYEVGVGKWLNPIFGLRLSGSVSDYYWKSQVERATTVGGIRVHPAYETRLKGVFLTGRLEALLDPVHFSPRWRSSFHCLDLNLSLGGEYGWAMKYGRSGVEAMECYYQGLTGTVQLLYNVDGGMALFVQPRALLAFYNVPYANLAEKKTYTDKIGSVNVGVRVMRPTKSERASFDKRPFERHLFVGAQLGGIKHMTNSKQVGDGSFNVLGAVHVGYRLAPLASAKLQVEYMLLNKQEQTRYEVQSGSRTFRYSGLWRHRYGYLNTKLAYQLNLSNLYQGYDASRRLNLYGQFGPMYSVLVTQGATLNSEEMAGGVNPVPLVEKRTGKGAWALFGGMVADLRLTDHWSLYAEPEVQYYLKNKYVGGGATFRLNDLLLKFSLGTSYRF